MSQHFFLVPGIKGRWREAFGDQAVEISNIDVAMRRASAESMVWIDVDRQEDLARLKQGRPELRAVAMTTNPSQQQGMAAFSSGVRGYCHALAVPEQLQQIALVVSNGGLWIGSDLMERAVSAVGQVVSSQPPGDGAAREDLLAKLSPREKDVALQVASGASNKVVARQLDITERTVKAHLTSIFEKLAVRDRLQLVIALRRGTEIPQTTH